MKWTYASIHVTALGARDERAVKQWLLVPQHAQTLKERWPPLAYQGWHLHDLHRPRG